MGKAIGHDYPYPFVPRFLDLDGHRLSYLDEGQGPVVVMLHGNPTWSFFYRNLIKLLSPHFRVIVPDHMGCGLSDKPQQYPYTLSHHIDNLDRLLHFLGVDRFSLVMHDWGGAIGMGLASRRVKQIEALVAMNTAAFRSKRMPWRIRLCRLPLVGSLGVRGVNLFARAALIMAVTKPLAPEIARGYLAPYDSWANRIGVHRFIQDIPLQPGHPSWQTLVDVEQGLASFGHTPMLLIWGGKDFCFTEHFFDEWQQRFPQAEACLLPEAGHYLLEDAMDQVGPKISAFFTKILLPQAVDS